LASFNITPIQPEHDGEIGQIIESVGREFGAITRYQKLGCRFLNAPLAGTLHNRCDTWMIKTLAPS